MDVTQREAINIESRSFSASCIAAQLRSASTRPSAFMSFISLTVSLRYLCDLFFPARDRGRFPLPAGPASVDIGAQQDSGDLII